MKYEIQDNVWPTMMKQAAQPMLMWRQIVLFIIFGLLLLLVILGCTLGPSPLVVVALFAAVALVVLVILRPPLALLLVFFGAGLPSLLLPLPGHTMHLVEPALLLCLLVIILRRPNLRLRLPHLLALLFVAIAIVSFIHVPARSPGARLPGADKRLVELITMFLAFFCGTFLLKYVKDASSFLVGVLLTNLPLYLIGLAQALGIPVPSLLESSSAQDPKQSLGRLWGPSPWPSTFAIYLVNLFAIALACWLLGRRRRDRTLGAIMTLATALEIVGSGTISAALAAIILVIVAFTLTRHFKMLLATVALAGGMVALFFNKILPHFAHDDSASRLFLWQETIKLIATHPWIGIGLQQFPTYMGQLVVSMASGLNSPDIQPHQQYLEWGVESGIPWLIVGILLLLSIAFFYWRAYRLSQHGQQVLLLAAILALLANIVIGFFDMPLDQVEGSVFFFLLAGLALSCAEHVCWGSPEHKTAWQM